MENVDASKVKRRFKLATSSRERVMSKNALTPDHLRSLFEEAQYFSSPPLLPASAQKTFRYPPLLPGEQILRQEQHVTCVDTFDGLAEGTLHLTTYRVIFTGSYTTSVEQGAVDDADPEEMARRGHFHQTRARQPSADKAAQKGTRKTNHKSTKKLHRPPRDVFTGSNMSGGLVRNGRFSQSMRVVEVAEAVPGLGCDKQVKLKTLTPLVVAQDCSTQDYDLEVSIPHTSVCEVRRFAKKNLPRDRVMFIRDGVELLCSNIQSYRFCLGLRSTCDAEKLQKILQQFTTIRNTSTVFAISYKKSIIIPKSCDILDNRSAPNFYNFEDEFNRLNLLESEHWKRHATKEPVQYPTQTIIPSSVSDRDLGEVAAFHRNGCFPAVCWRHKEHGAVMLRCSASLSRRGLKESRCKADEQIMVGLCLANLSATKNKLAIFTEHGRHGGAGILASSAPLTQMTGQLTPEQGETFYYPNCRFVLAESLADFKSVRSSAQKLQSYLATKVDDGRCLSSLGDTEWLSQISELLETATQVVVAMENDQSSVLIGYEDGMDRTAQLTSLAQLLLDPYYRTLDGFQVLVQKEWLSFGHKFADRSLPLKNNDEHSPVFLQWLDCVWQVVQQFPFSFEFDELLLETLAKHPYSSRFGTFLVNSEREMDEKEVDSATASLWTWLNVVCMSDPDRFKNLRYTSSEQQRVLIPHYRLPCLRLWSSLYLGRHRQEHLQDEAKAAKLQALKLEEHYKDLLTKRSKLLQRLAEMDSARPFSTAFSSASISTALRSQMSWDRISSGSSSSLGSSDTVPTPSDEDSVGLSASAVSLTSTLPRRRMTRSRSLDDMLERQVRQKSLKRQPRSVKRRIGGSKFYTEELLNLRNKEANHLCRPIKEKFGSLNEYLDNTGIDYRADSSVQVTSAQCCGFMVKQGKIRKNWKKRWFVLDLTKKYLAYFETDKAECLKGVIGYQTIRHVYEHAPGGRQPHLFCVETPGRTYTISAPNERSKRVWMACLTVPLYALDVSKATS